jgi:hypothetical protein
MAEVAIVSGSHRDSAMGHVRERCTKAWIEGDFENAQCLNGLCDSLEHMTDEEYDAKLCCSHPECDCQY